jgi:hypothetical protein
VRFGLSFSIVLVVVTGFARLAFCQAAFDQFSQTNITFPTDSIVPIADDTSSSGNIVPISFDLGTLAPSEDAAATQNAAGGPGGPTTVQEAYPTFPLLAEEARKRGYELPLPFGVGAVYNYLERDIKVTDLRIGINGAFPTSVSDFVNLGSRSHVNVGLGRFDMFLFPFLDLYTLLGYVQNSSTTQGIVTVPRPGPIPGFRVFPFTAGTNIDGFVGGFGAALGAGYKQFFAALDANWAQTDLGFDDAFRAVIASVRGGWNGKIGHVPVRLWTGVAYWDTACTASSTVFVPNVGLVSFEADQGPTNPWNMIFGGQVSVHKNFDLMVEYGTDYDRMQYVAAALTFRF